MSDNETIDWGKEASKIIKKAMLDKGVKAPELAEMLSKNGSEITQAHINNRLSKGNYKASWFLEVLSLLGADNINL